MSVGPFRFDAVRPGTYLVIALDYLQTWQANDPGFLEELRERATKMTITEGPLEPVALRIQK